MKVTVLGCGPAGGVPSLSRGWGACDPAEPRNRRLRPSILVESGATAILVDTSPDLREQLLAAEVRRLDAVIYTHSHADHLHGIDDLREVNRAMRAPLACWGDAETIETIRQRFAYVFEPLDLTAVPVYKPILRPVEITGTFRVGAVEVVPFAQGHGWSGSLGFRFGGFAYSTDVVEMPEEGFTALAGIDVWVLTCFQLEPHPTHAHLAKALQWIERVKPRRAVLTHMSHLIDYATVKALCPPHVEPAWDGMVIEL